MSEEDQIVTLLGSLPPSYSNVVTALEARIGDLTLDFVQQQLNHYELKLKASSPTDSSQDTALLSRKPQRGRGPPTCWNCFEVGHVQRFCPKPKRSKPKHEATVADEETADDNKGEGGFATPNDTTANAWLLDSGASSHMTPNIAYFTTYRKFNTPERVCLGDGRVVEAVGVGNVRLKMLFKASRPKHATMYDVLHVPKLTCDLFSVRAATNRRNIIKFGHDKCWIRGGSGTLYGMGCLAGKLYQLECEVVLPSQEQAKAASESSDLWHLRLGHLNSQQLNQMVQQNLVTGMKFPIRSDLSFCEGCIADKMQCKPFRTVNHNQSTKKLELIHSDVCGPMQVDSIGGSRYFVTFVDDYSRCVAVYFVKHKSEVFEKFKALNLL